MVYGEGIKKLTGELLDCVIPLWCDPEGLGYKKISCALEHGCGIPLQYYIEELETIAVRTQDDKSEKRQKRLEFLKLCNFSPILQQYFVRLIRYLNGDGIDELGKYIFDDNTSCILHGNNSPI